MRFVLRLVLLGCWIIWFYPFVFRAPHRQKRPSITVAGPTRVGLLLECAAIFIASVHYIQPDFPPIIAIVFAVVCAVIAILLAWTSVPHLGKQFRLHAGLYEDHQLVRSGPYAVVRHPIYASLLAMLICTMLLLGTPWPWVLGSLALFIAGTEIRVRSEEKLLESRFGEEFRNYRRSVPAYLPFIR